MGPQRILQAVAVVASVAIGRTSPVAAEPRIHERIAVIDLGAGLGSGPAASPSAPVASHGFADVQQALGAAIVAAGLDPVIGDGVEDALAGRNVDRDTVEIGR